MSDEANRVPPPARVVIPPAHVELWKAVRNKRDAKAAAELVLGKRVRPKEIGGRCGLFVETARNTDYVGHTWPAAFGRLIYLLAERRADPEAQEQIAATTGEIS